MITSNYKLDTRYALVGTDIIDNKKNIIYTEAITFFNSISDMDHITQNTDITSQLSTYIITPIIHNHVVTHIQIIIIHTRYFNDYSNNEDDFPNCFIKGQKVTVSWTRWFNCWQKLPSILNRNSQVI